MTLTLVQWLQRYSHKGCILKFIDAHTGPYKDKQCYWPRFLLLVRAGMFIFNSRTNQWVNAALVSLWQSLLFAWCFIFPSYEECTNHVYWTSLRLSSLFQEIFSKPNLHLLLCVAYISVGIAFVYTSLLFVYHAAVRISTTSLGCRIKGIMPIVCDTIKQRFNNYEKLILGPVINDSECESNTSEARSPLSTNWRVTHSSIAIWENELFLSYTY